MAVVLFLLGLTENSMMDPTSEAEYVEGILNDIRHAVSTYEYVLNRSFGSKGILSKYQTRFY